MFLSFFRRMQKLKDDVHASNAMLSRPNLSAAKDCLESSQLMFRTYSSDCLESKRHVVAY